MEHQAVHFGAFLHICQEGGNSEHENNQTRAGIPDVGVMCGIQELNRSNANTLTGAAARMYSRKDDKLGQLMNLF